MKFFLLLLPLVWAQTTTQGRLRTDCPSYCNGACTIGNYCDATSLCVGDACKPGHGKSNCAGTRLKKDNGGVEYGHACRLAKTEWDSTSSSSQSPSIKWHRSKDSCWYDCNNDSNCKGCGTMQGYWYTYDANDCSSVSNSPRNNAPAGRRRRLAKKSSSSYKSSSKSSYKSTKSSTSRCSGQIVQKTADCGDMIYECCKTENCGKVDAKTAGAVVAGLLGMCCCCCCIAAAACYFMKGSSGQNDNETQMAVTDNGDGTAAPPPGFGNTGGDGTGEPPLPEGWEAKVDPASGATYYCFTATGATQWTRPEGSNM